jgi:two-component system, sensor histidine kinase and response regulator
MRKILLIENDTDSIKLISLSLSKEEYSLDIADNLLQGYQQSLKNLPELIILGRNIYNNDIFDVLNQLRDETNVASIPFIFIVDKKTTKKPSRNTTGFDFYINKPFSKNELIKIIENALAKYDTVHKRSEQKLNELRGSITFSLPHEFFTPLNGILGFSEILIKEFDNLSKTEIIDMLRYINVDAIRLKKLTENFIAFAQLELTAKDAEKIELLRQSYFTNPKEIISTAAHQISKNFNREEDLVLEIEDGFIRISEEYIKKVISETIDNAFKFSKKGTPVIVSIMKNETSVMISISDNGMGMTPVQISSIGAYMQFNRKLHDQQGSGLGLIIAKKITELHGGDFIIESSLQSGTKINIIFNN